MEFKDESVITPDSPGKLAWGIHGENPFGTIISDKLKEIYGKNPVFEKCTCTQTFQTYCITCPMTEQELKEYQKRLEDRAKRKTLTKPEVAVPTSYISEQELASGDSAELWIKLFKKDNIVELDFYCLDDSNSKELLNFEFWTKGQQLALVEMIIPELKEIGSVLSKQRGTDLEQYQGEQH